MFTVPWAIAPSGEWPAVLCVYATTGAADSPRNAHGAQPIWNTDWTARCGVLVGAEGDGLTEASLAACDAVVEIPMHGEVPSVNVAAAAAICLYERMRSVRT